MSLSARSVTRRPTSLCVLRSMPLAPVGQRLVSLGTALLVLWLLAVIAGPTWLAHSGLALNAHGHAALHAHGHPFVDARSLWGVPNFMDVWTNLAMGVAGLLGGWALLRGGPWAPGTRLALAVFFGGLLATCFGSAWYHLAPDNASLLWDRLPMTIAFMGLVAAQIVDRISVRAGLILLIGERAGLTQSEAGRILGIKRANMVPLTAKLEARGLLERLQLTGRSQELVLTAIGKRMLAKVRASITAHETETMARVPEDLRAHVIPILTALWGPESDAD